MSKRKSKTRIEFGHGLAMQWLPVNQAWLVMWHDQRLGGPWPKPEAEAYVARMIAARARDYQNRRGVR